ncbi:MAG: hypothetical protein Q9220_001182 [cf. Caloplaca sp. 1 TL-2023]
MHFSTLHLVFSLFSFSLALPSPLSSRQEARPGRLNVSYDASPKIIGFQTLSSGGMKAGNPPVQAKESGAFTIKAYNSESPIHMMDINASNRKFFVGNMTGSECPPSVQDCPAGNVTALSVNSTGGANLVRPFSSSSLPHQHAYESRMLISTYQDVANPYSQRIYIGPRAQLRFNPPGVSLASDIRPGIFALQPNPIPAPPGISAFIFSGVGLATGYLACPVAPGGPYQVFADLAILKDAWVPLGDKSACIGIDALATDFTGTGKAAWEYV